MRKKSIHLCALCTALIAFLFAACSQGKDYREVIPADAFMVTSMNPKSLAHKAQIGDFTQSPLYAQIEKLVNEESGMTPENQEYLLSLVAQPSKAGLSMDHDSFMFLHGEDLASGNMGIGIVYKVGNRGEVDKFIEWGIANEMPLEKEDVEGLTLYTDGDNRNAVALAYDDNTFVVYVSPMNPEDGVEKLKALFAQKKEESIMGKPHAAAVLDGSNDMSVFFSYSAIWPTLEQQMGMLGGMAGLDWLGKMSIVVPVNFEKGQIVSEMRIYFDDKEAEKQYQDMAAVNLTMNGDLLKYLPQGSVAAFGSGINGEKTYEMLQKIPMYSMVLAMAPQAKTIFDAIDGDMVLSFNTMSAGGEFPEMTLLARVKDPDMQESLLGLMNMGGVPHRNIAPGQYEGSIEDIPYWFGVRDGLFYVTSDVRAIALMDNGGESMHDKYGHLFTNNYGGFVIDFNALCDMLEKLIVEGAVDVQVGMALPYISLFEDAYMTTGELTRADMVTNMADKDKNAADVLYHSIEQLIVMLIGMGL